MGHADNLTLGLNSDLMSLSVPKLRDDGSNWADYKPRVERALGMKGLWRHPKSHLAIVPSQTHVGLMMQTKTILGYLDDFLK